MLGKVCHTSKWSTTNNRQTRRAKRRKELQNPNPIFSDRSSYNRQMVRDNLRKHGMYYSSDFAAIKPQVKKYALRQYLKQCILKNLQRQENNKKRTFTVDSIG
jgi:hypothetical protein